MYFALQLRKTCPFLLFSINEFCYLEKNNKWVLLQGSCQWCWPHWIFAMLSQTLAVRTYPKGKQETDPAAGLCKFYMSWYNMKHVKIVCVYWMMSWTSFVSCWSKSVRLKHLKVSLTQYCYRLSMPLPPYCFIYLITIFFFFCWNPWQSSLAIEINSELLTLGFYLLFSIFFKRGESTCYQISPIQKVAETIERTWSILNQTSTIVFSKCVLSRSAHVPRMLWLLSCMGEWIYAPEGHRPINIKRQQTNMKEKNKKKNLAIWSFSLHGDAVTCYQTQLAVK